MSMQKTTLTASPINLRARLGVVTFYLLCLVSGVLVLSVGVIGFMGFENTPIEQQLEMPAVMPYDVVVMEPWLLVVGHIVWGALIVGSTIYLIWNTLRAMQALSAHYQPRLYLRFASLSIICFWVVSILIYIFAIALQFGIIGGVQIGLS